MSDLPKDITDLLNTASALIPDPQPAPIGNSASKPENVTVLRAVQPPTDIHENQKWRNSVAALRNLADAEESGEEAPIIRSVLVAQREDGSLAVHGIGPLADDLALISLLQLGLHQITSEMLG